MKNTIRRIFRFMRVKKRVLQRENSPLCYSAGGFLADILEHHGFIIKKLVWNGSFYIVEATPIEDEKLLKERLKRNMRKTAIVI